MQIPKQYLPVMPYIIVKDASAFVQFLQNVFGATEQLNVPGEDGKLMHGEYRIGDAVIMCANAHEQWAEKTSGMYLYVEDVKGVYELAINNGAESIMPPGQKEYGFTAGFNDPFGNQWWIVEAE